MDGIVLTFITLAVLCALLVLMIGAFCLRRYQLRTALGTFDASIPYQVSSAGWGTLRVWVASAVDGSPESTTDYPVWLTP